VSPAQSTDAAAVAAEVLRSRRYRWVAPDLIARLAGEAVAGSARPAEAVKRVKRRLHQVCGAYVSDVRPEAILEELREASAEGGLAELRAACRRVLARHASTRERLPVLETFYPAVFARTGIPRVLLDVACGLGPLAWPWMGLPPDVVYRAYDVDRRLVEIVDGFLTLVGVPHEAAQRDVVGCPPEGPADVALLLKSAPCLEQQAPGSTRRLFEALDVRHVVLSYPTRSLGGAARSMIAHYRAQVDALLTGSPWRVAELPFPLETVYVLTRPELGDPYHEPGDAGPGGL
jgi:16S rRNA (guanine(1405)-N(7))-methyltransferase